MKINIKRAIVLTHPYLTDKVALYTDLPSPFPIYPTELLSLTFQVEAGKGLDYVTEHFEIEGEIEVIQTEEKYGKFSK
jgi:hypothetical protein